MVVDYSTLDIEGFEYPLLKGLLDGGVFKGSSNYAQNDQTRISAAGLTFCQMDVEFHTPEMSNKFADKLSKTSEFGAYFRKFLEVGAHTIRCPCHGTVTCPLAPATKYALCLQETDFVPVLAETFLSHRKATLVNPIHPHCVEAFALDKYLHA